MPLPNGTFCVREMRERYGSTAYRGPVLARWVRTVAAITVEVVGRTSLNSFHVARCCWPTG